MSQILKSFIPWILFYFFAGSSHLSVEMGSLAALMALLVLQYKELRQGFIFDWGTLIFFIFLSVSLLIIKNAWIAEHASLLSNTMLALIAWFSLAIRMPFTLQYARKSVPSEHWQSLVFIRINYIITFVWAVVLLLMAVVSFLHNYEIMTNHWLTNMVSTALPIFAVVFTMHFPNWYKSIKGIKNETS